MISSVFKLTRLVIT